MKVEIDEAAVDPVSIAVDMRQRDNRCTVFAVHMLYTATT